MGKFTQIPQDAFDGLQLNAGILMKKFDLETGEVNNADIICATTGGITISCKPSYSDYAEDVDNAPTNLKEFKQLDGWECGISTTSLGTSRESIRMALGAADIDADSGKIVPRRDLQQTDFSDLWWGGDRADGGLVAVRLKNALSTSGFSLKTSKAGKGNTSVTLTGHVTASTQQEVPMEFWSAPPAAASPEAVLDDGGLED